MFTYYSDLKPRALVLGLVGIALSVMAVLVGIPSDAQATRFRRQNDVRLRGVWLKC
jgi:hypothetical protein